MRTYSEEGGAANARGRGCIYIDLGGVAQYHLRLLTRSSVRSFKKDSLGTLHIEHGACMELYSRLLQRVAMAKSESGCSHVESHAYFQSVRHTIYG